MAKAVTYTLELFTDRKIIVENKRLGTPCWEWTGRVDKQGYGLAWYNGRQWGTHRVVYMIINGVVLDRYQLVCHECDNPRCINPQHLFLGTHQDNVDDMHKKGRWVSGNAAKTHCKRGHEYTPENTYRNPGFPNRRTCRICQSAGRK